MPQIRRHGADWQEHDQQEIFDRLRAVAAAQNAGTFNPYMSAYAAAATSCPNGTDTHIPMTQSIAGYGLSISSGDVSVTVAGIYQINFGVAFAGSAVNGGFSILEQNGGAVRWGSSLSFNGDPARQSAGSAILKCAANDTISLYAHQNTGGALAVASGLTHTYLEMFQLGSA